MAILTKTIVVGLLALYHGLVMGAVVNVAGMKESVRETTPHLKSTSMTTVSVASETLVASWNSTHHRHTFTTIYSDTFLRLRTTQNVEVVGLAQSSALDPTRAGQDAHRPVDPTLAESTTQAPRPYQTTLGNSPVMTEVPQDNKGFKGLQAFLDILAVHLEETRLSPRDDYDGYGYGSSTRPATNGGYGSPPESTGTPPAGYGDPPPPAMDEPSIATITDPVTVTVTLSTSSRTKTPTVAVVTVTSTPVPQAPMQNITQPVPDPDPVSPLYPVVTILTTSTGIQQLITPQVPVGDPTSSSLVNTPAVLSSSASHTPTHTAPRPITDTNAAELTRKLDYGLMSVAAALALTSIFMSSVIFGLAFLLEVLDNSTESGRKDGSREESNDERSATGCKTGYASNKYDHPESSAYGCCKHNLLHRVPTTGFESEVKAGKQGA
ncbi:hypothetical protein GGR52DRAFT_590469 [Hypoxylon sp. FL1284]|nr:hypothetical protein GGR52DRAFT_590469 [Hypoxylon sp. FL1284]